jgi:hypothetical protein
MRNRTQSEWDQKMGQIECVIRWIWDEIQDAMHAINPGVSQIYTPRESIHHCYPCICVHPPWPSPFPSSSVSNGSAPSLRVLVRVQAEPMPNWRSGLSINPNRQLRQCSTVNSQPVWNRWDVRRSLSRSIYRFIYCSCFCSLLIVSCQNHVFNNQ